MKFSDAALGCFLSCFAIAMMAFATTFPLPQGSAFGPGLFPIVIGALMLCTGLVLIWQGIRARAVRPLMTLDPWTRQTRPVLNVALVLGLPILYVIGADSIGFLPLAAVLLFVLTWQLSGRLGPALVSAAIVPLAIHTVFVKFLLVPLPWGLLQPVAW